MERRPDKRFCWGCGILLEKKSLWKNPHSTRPIHTKRKEKYGFVDIKTRNISFTSHLLRLTCGRLSPWKSSKRQIADLKGPSLLRKLEKTRKWKRKPLLYNSNLPFDLKNGQFIVWLCHDLNCLPWQSCQSPGRVCSVTWRAFSLPGSFVGKQGDSRGEREIGEATHADFFRAVYLFFLVYFVLFSPVSFFFFQK